MAVGIFRRQLRTSNGSMWKRPTVAGLSLLLLALAPAPSQAQGYLNVYDLGTLGGTTSKAYAIANNRIVGSSSNASGFERATVWAFSAFSPYAPVPSIKQELPALSGATTSVAYAISGNLQRIVGSSTGSNTLATGWAWDNTVITGGVTPYRSFNIHPTDGYDNSIAYAVTTYTQNVYAVFYPYNFIGTYYGNFYGGTFSSSSPAHQPFGGTWVTPPGASTMYQISSHIFGASPIDSGRLAYSRILGAAGNAWVGQDITVGGMWNPLDSPRAFCRYPAPLWTNPQHTDITDVTQWDMCAGDVPSEATAITPDSAGSLTVTKTVTGWTTVSGQRRGFIWIKSGGSQLPQAYPSPGSAPVLTILPTLGGDTTPYGIRKSGAGTTTVVVGTSDVSGVPHAFAHYGGSIRDLNSILPAGSGWVLKEARGCIEMVAGTWLIVGFGDYTVGGVTNQRAFLLVINGVPT